MLLRRLKQNRRKLKRSHLKIYRNAWNQEKIVNIEIILKKTVKTKNENKQLFLMEFTKLLIQSVFKFFITLFNT